MTRAAKPDHTGSPATSKRCGLTSAGTAWTF